VGEPNFEVVNVFPHDRGAYTQGLVFQNGSLIESTGEVGRSSLRLVEAPTGNILRRVTVPTPYFAEGITELNGKIYQLTWQHQTGFIYDTTTFQKLGEFKYYGEGWGLTDADGMLILSDGSSQLRFLDPETFQVKKTLKVLDHGAPVPRLNELEYMNGEILANVWHQDRIARIDPQTGQVRSWIILNGLLSPGEVTDEEAVLNGIAYDEQSKRLFVTGKMWPKMFEIRIKE
jgi:glutamine cyclotransferase